MTKTIKTDAARLLDAASFAANKHREQRRRDAEATPYINHPLEVARILADAGIEDTEVLMAAILHDTIEDTETTAQELNERFGERVCALVLEVTDDKTLGKIERKRLQVVKAPTKSADARTIKLADKIANLRDLKQSPPEWDQERIGAYVHFAELVAGGCAGVSSALDAKFSQTMRDFS